MSAAGERPASGRPPEGWRSCCWRWPWRPPSSPPSCRRSSAASSASTTTRPWLLAQGRATDALPHFEHAVRCDPGDGRAWTGLGSAQRALKRFAAARESWLRATQLLVPATVPRLNLGILYMGDLAQPAAALAQFEAALAELERLGPEWFAPQPHLYLGIALLDTGAPARARAPADRRATHRDAR